MRIYIEYIAGLGDTLIDIPYFKKYLKENKSHEIHIQCDNILKEIFVEFCKEVNVVEVSDARTFDPTKIDPHFKNAYEKHIIINGLLSWAFYTKDKKLWEQRGEIFFPNTKIKERDLIFKFKNSIPDDIFKDFNFPVVFNASKPVAQSQGKAISKILWDEIINTFTDITFVQIGSSSSDYTFTQKNVVDLRDRLVSQSLSVIPFSKFVIGTDNVLNHASMSFNKPGIFFWGSNDPKQYGYEKNINLYNPPKCSPCLHNRIGNKTFCCQYPYINTIEFNSIKKSINKLLKETTC